jgi:hypothetical protein
MDKSIVYQIHLTGHLSPHWSQWLDNMQITHTPEGETILRGRLEDQAALFGLLAKLRDLGTPLLALRRIEEET